MTRTEATEQIGDLLDNHCADCPTRQELNKIHGSTYSKIDGHCNRECPIGKQLQGLSKHLTRL